MAKKKKTCAVMDKNTLELHELYGKHEFHPISDRNAIEFCAGCGSWSVHLNRADGLKDESVLVPLLPKDFGDSGPFNLPKVMAWLSPRQQLSLAAYLQSKGYGAKRVTRRVELEKYLNKEAAK